MSTTTHKFEAIGCDVFIEGTEVQVKEVAKYLGDESNNKGTNTHLVDERVKKARHV